MFNDMFKEPGKRLKSFSKLIFWIILIIHIIIALAEILVVKSVSFGMIIATVVIGIFFGFLASIVLYAFGELVEDVHTIAIHECNIQNILVSRLVSNPTTPDGQQTVTATAEKPDDPDNQKRHTWENWK